MTRELEELFDAVQAAALTSRYGTATTGNLRRRLATAGDLLPGLAQLHAQGRILLEQRQGRNGPFWTARPLDPSRTVFPADLESVRHYAEEAISQSGRGRLAPFSDNVRRHFAWMEASCADVLNSAFAVLQALGRASC